jgi:hypothetical protein
VRVAEVRPLPALSNARVAPSDVEPSDHWMVGATVLVPIPGAGSGAGAPAAASAL